MGEGRGSFLSHPRASTLPQPPRHPSSPPPSFAQVRIYKVLDVSEESKAWRKEHGPGYPPQLDAVLKTSKAFKQIHGF